MTVAQSFATWSYSASAAAYLALAVGVGVRWRSSPFRRELILALAFGVPWAIACAMNAAGLALSALVAAALEIARDAGWCWCLICVLRSAARPPPSRMIVYGLLFLTGVALLAVVPLLASWSMPLLTPLLLVGSVGGLLLAAQTYRSTRTEHIWLAKLLWLAVAAIFLYDVVLYSAALALPRSARLLWDGRGAVNVILAALLAAGVARLNRAASVQLLSPRLIFFSTGVIAAGIYLLVVASAGYYLEILGGSWGGFLELVFVAAAVVLLGLVAVSGRARSSLRVFVSKYIVPYRYDYRREWLRVVRTMDADADRRPLADRAVAALGQLVDADLGGLWLIDDDHFVAAGGEMAGTQLPPHAADPAFVDALCGREWIIDLAAVRAGREAAPFPLEVPQWLVLQDRVRFVVPMIQETRLVGILTLGGALAERSLSWEDIDLLRAAGRQVASYVALESAARKLSEARQFEAYNRFAAFVMHDLKNLIAQQRLVVENAVRHKSNPAFVDDAIATIDNSVRRMSRLLGQLRRGGADGGERRVNLAALCGEVATRCSRRAPQPQLSVADESIELVLSPERFASILENLVLNAQEATPEDGRVDIEVSRGGGRARVVVSDTGRGMDEQFLRDRLFRPFDTTKGSQGMGIGAYLAREFVHGLGGRVVVESVPDRGTQFMIELPLSMESTR